MAEINQQKFINDMMYYAFGAESPEQILPIIVAYIGKNLDSDRAFIFEKNSDGTFSNTYEWCREGVPEQKDSRQNIPCEGYMEYRQSDTIVIYDLEEYRTVSETLYRTLKAQGVVRMVTGLIEIDGECVGFYGVENPPVEFPEDISSLIHLMSFVIVMSIKLRNYAEKMAYLATVDDLTGCGNRAAFNRVFERKYDEDQSLGIIMCDLNGLKVKNDRFGHEAGDRYLKEAAEILKEVFQKENVFRVGGDEFVIVVTAWEEAQIAACIGQVRELSAKRNISFAAGYGYRARADCEFEEVYREADQRMYEDKRAYY
ncbi:MAG: GGDEF domain-containing protein, partial [Anaerovoracaceae bacterium]